MVHYTYISCLAELTMVFFCLFVKSYLERAMYVLKGGMKITVMSGHKNDQCCRHHYCVNKLISHLIKKNGDIIR